MICLQLPDDIPSLNSDSSSDSDDDLNVDDYYFLQPVPTRQRRLLLRQSGKSQRSPESKLNCHLNLFSWKTLWCGIPHDNIRDKVFLDLSVCLQVWWWNWISTLFLNGVSMKIVSCYIPLGVRPFSVYSVGDGSRQRFLCLVGGKKNKNKNSRRQIFFFLSETFWRFWLFLDWKTTDLGKKFTVFSPCRRKK